MRELLKARRSALAVGAGPGNGLLSPEGCPAVLSQSAGRAHLSLVPEFRRYQGPAPTPGSAPPKNHPSDVRPARAHRRARESACQGGLWHSCRVWVGTCAGSLARPQAPVARLWLGVRGARGGRTRPALCCRRWWGGRGEERLSCVNPCARSVPALRSSPGLCAFTISAAACLRKHMIRFLLNGRVIGREPGGFG